MKGSTAYKQEWRGGTWLFSSEANRARFAENPAQYAPQFGGYCAWAVSNGYTAGIDPDAWKIVDGKLYLNYSKGVQKKWAGDQENRIRAAEKNWPGLHR